MAADGIVSTYSRNRQNLQQLVVRKRHLHPGRGINLVSVELKHRLDCSRDFAPCSRCPANWTGVTGLSIIAPSDTPLTIARELSNNIIFQRHPFHQK